MVTCRAAGRTIPPFTPGSCVPTAALVIWRPEQFTSSDEWAEDGAILNTMICEKHDMPHSQVSHGVAGKIGFWNDRVAQQDMGNFLKSLGINSCLPSD